MSTIDRLLMLAKEKGISQAFICSKLGLSRTYLSDVRSGKARLSEERISAIADLLNTTPEYLKGETDVKEKAPAITVYDEHDNIIRLDDDTLEAIDSMRTRPDMKLFFSVIKNADPEDLKKAIKIIEALKDESK